MVKFNKILCAVDFSDYSPEVAKYAATLAKMSDAKIICLYVAPSLDQYVGFHVPPSSVENFVGEMITGASTTMETFVNENFEDLDVEIKITDGYVSEEIIDIAEKENVDLIVMGTHGRTGIDKILFGSVAEKIVKTAKCPVLTIRPEEIS